jgi:glycolate oxidase FAD binding subunit
MPVGTRTVQLQVEAPAAIERLTQAAQQGLPLSASYWHPGELQVRLEGSAAALDAIAPVLGGTALDAATAATFWADVREQRLAFFRAAAPLWRLSLPTTAAAAALRGVAHGAFEWHGAQVWLAGVERAEAQRIARAAGGDATLFRRAADDHDDACEAFTPLAPGLFELHRAVKRVFDPAGILNPGRMYAGL